MDGYFRSNKASDTCVLTDCRTIIYEEPEVPCEGRSAPEHLEDLDFGADESTE